MYLLYWGTWGAQSVQHMTLISAQVLILSVEPT